MPESTLNTAVNKLIEDVSSKVLGKRKLKEGDTVTINDIKLSCDIFQRLRAEE